MKKLHYGTMTTVKSPAFARPSPSGLTLIGALPVLVALKILRDILSFTCSFMINTRSLVGCLENSDRKVIKIIPCYTADCFKSSCLQFVDTMSYVSECVWFCNVTPDLYRENCHATDIVLTEQLGWNGF